MKQNKIIVAMLKDYCRYDIVPYWLGTKAGIFFEMENCREFEDFQTACQWKKTANLDIRRAEAEEKELFD